MLFERIYWIWRGYEIRGKRTILQELDELVSCGEESFNAMVSYGENFSSLYDAFIDDNIKVPVEIIKFFARVKDVSKEAYDFLTGGHDIGDLKNYLKNNNSYKENRFDNHKDLIDFLRHIRYMFSRIVNESDEEKKKKILRGLLGM